MSQFSKPESNVLGPNSGEEIRFDTFEQKGFFLNPAN